MKIKEIELSKLKELKEKSKMLKDERQKGKVIYKIWDIVVVVILAVLADCNEWEEMDILNYKLLSSNNLNITKKDTINKLIVSFYQNLNSILFNNIRNNSRTYCSTTFTYSKS